MGVLDGLKPEKVFHYFEEISKIPHGSGNEKEIAEYCVKFAKERGLEAFSDKNNNVVIKKAGTPGMENNDAVILQAHLDMVCEKNAGISHDFSKDPLKLYIDGDNIRAEGTTLGADDGAGVAMILAVLDEKDAAHPPLECFLTSEEEVGLKGAMSFDYSPLKGKYLINLDTSVYGEAIVSCAGGVRTDTELKINWVDTSLTNSETYAIRVRGLKGGHSGNDIHLERANANKLIGRVLDNLFGKIDYEICSISGGAKDNAIPRESQAYININAGDETKLTELISALEDTFKQEYKIQENELSLKCSKEEHINKVFCKETAGKAIGLIKACPNGVLAMSHEIENLVETSNNLGIITMEEDKIVFSCAARSSVESRKELVEAMLKNIAILAGVNFSSKSHYPGWRYDPESHLRNIASQTYKELTGNNLGIRAVHGGLECGIIKEKLSQEADVISIGPDMWDYHTPDERLSIAGTEKAYIFLLKLLEKL